MLVFEESGIKLEYPEKPLGARMRTDNKLNPHKTPSPGIKPGPHWWEASALTTAPSLLPILRHFNYNCFLRWPNTVCARFTDSVSDAIKRALGLW